MGRNTLGNLTENTNMQLKLPLILVFLLTSFASTAAWAVVEFSAQTVESQPGQDPRNGYLYVAKDRVRSDIDVNGEAIIQIIDIGRQEAIVINSARKSYMRRRASEGEIQAQTPPAADADPCAGMQNLVCRQSGTETVNGRKALKWEISNPAAEQAGIMRFWLDAEHRFPVRQEMPDGSRLELRLLKQETVNGRNTEKWEMTVSRADGNSQVSWRWYDPEIRMIVREELPGGFTRNLTDIKLKPQPAELFSIPAGYTEISIPQQPGR
jgi:hypothetical protein